MLEFWFEFASTYSYPVAMTLGEQAEALGVEIRWRPFLLGPIFADHGMNDSPFNLNPTKGAYMWRDLERLCEDEHLRWRKPSEFPRNGLLAARVAYALQESEAIESFVQAVYVANFVDDLDISMPDVLFDCLPPELEDPELALEDAMSDATKEGLRAQTERAKTLGLFGAPSFTVGEELFWGGDRMKQALTLAAESAG